MYKCAEDKDISLIILPEYDTDGIEGWVNDNDSNNSYINYEGSSSIFNSTIYDNKNGFIGENKENYVIQSEDGKTLIQSF